MTIYRVVAKDPYFVVMKGDQVVSRPFIAKEPAELKMDTLEKRARAKDRPCITCGKTFRSQGIHNRMCRPCKLSSREVFNGAV